MKAIWTTLRILGSFIAMAGLLWLIAAASDHVWPEAKWFFIAIFVDIWVFMFARPFAGGMGEYRAVMDAYTHRKIQTTAYLLIFSSLLMTRHSPRLRRSSAPLHG